MTRPCRQGEKMFHPTPHAVTTTINNVRNALTQVSLMTFFAAWLEALLAFISYTMRRIWRTSRTAVFHLLFSSPRSTFVLTNSGSPRFSRDAFVTLSIIALRVLPITFSPLHPVLGAFIDGAHQRLRSTSLVGVRQTESITNRLGV